MQKKIGKMRRRGIVKKMVEAEWRTRLRAEIERSGKAMRRISIEAGLDQSYLSELFRKKTSEPTIGALQRICTALGVTTPYILEGYELTPATQRIVAAFSGMTPEEQEAFLTLVERKTPQL